MLRHHHTDAGETPGISPTRAQLVALAQAIYAGAGGNADLPQRAPVTQQQIAALGNDVRSPDRGVIILDGARVYTVTLDGHAFAVVVSRDRNFIWLAIQMGSSGVSNKYDHLVERGEWDPASTVVVELLALVAWPTSVPINGLTPALPSENGPDMDGPGQGQPPANLTVLVAAPFMDAAAFVAKVDADAQHINEQFQA